MEASSYVPLDDAAAATPSSPEAAEVSVYTVAATAVATSHLMLKLEGYSRLKATHGENGSYIESCAFNVGGHEWRIRCYLNGNRKEHAGFVSLFLHLSNYAAGPVVLAEYELALVPHQGKPSQTSQVVRRTFGGKTRYCGGWGRPRFISVKELERSRFLKDDCLAVRCTVTVVEERTAKEEVVVQAHDMERLMGMLCKCDDDLCKRHHARPADRAYTLLERFANFCNSICRGPGPFE